jgi:glycosyltransferase involved in cell wall biosynthesis
MDIVTSSSSYGEALPMTLCEAMSCGTPCVATSIGDTAVLIGDSGLIVEPRDPAALAEAWQTVLDLPAMKYGQLSTRARKRILEFYNRSRMVAEYKAIYKGLKEPS